MTIALAQSSSIRGNVEENIHIHCRFIEKAAALGADLIAFPELSLTGYEPDLASNLKFRANDRRLTRFKELSKIHQMIIIAGAPIMLDSNLHIGAYIIYPDQNVSVYTKHHLHDGEGNYFVAGSEDPKIKLGSDTISLAICADITHSIHAENAYYSGSSMYLSSVFITEKGYADDADLLQKYAQNFGMNVFMVNVCGISGGYQSAGKSAVWNKRGKLISALNADDEGLLIASKTNESWNCEHFYF